MRYRRETKEKMRRKTAGGLTSAADKEPPISANRARKIRTIIAPLVALTLFLAAIMILHRIVAHYHLAEIRKAFHSIAAPQLFLCFGFSCLSYLALSLYDLLACRYINRPLSYPKILLTSFLSYAFANNTGSLAVIASGTVRYRLYGGWGLSGEEVARIMGFCLVAFWLGFLWLGGWAFVLEPLFLPPELHLPDRFSLLPVGLLFLAMVGAYLLACCTIKKPLLGGGVSAAAGPGPGTDCCCRGGFSFCLRRPLCAAAALRAVILPFCRTLSTPCRWWNCPIFSAAWPAWGC